MENAEQYREGTGGRKNSEIGCTTELIHKSLEIREEKHRDRSKQERCEEQEPPTLSLILRIGMALDLAHGTEATATKTPLSKEEKRKANRAKRRAKKRCLDRAEALEAAIPSSPNSPPSKARVIGIGQDEIDSGIHDGSMGRGWEDRGERELVRWGNMMPWCASYSRCP